MVNCSHLPHVNNRICVHTSDMLDLLHCYLIRLVRNHPRYEWKLSHVVLTEVFQDFIREVNINLIFRSVDGLHDCTLNSLACGIILF